MNFTNLSNEVNEQLTAATKKSDQMTVKAFLDAIAHVDPVAKAAGYGKLQPSLTLTTRNKPTCSFLAGNVKKPNDYSVEEMNLYPPFGSIVDGSDPRTLMVLQAEYGVAVPPIPTKDSNTSDNKPTYIASPDATSCLIIGCRASLVGAPQFVSATAIGHFDREGRELVQGLQGMFVKTLLPAIGDQIRVWLETEPTVADGLSTVMVEWYMVGGMVDQTHTLPCIVSTLRDFMLPLFQEISLQVQGAHIGKAAGKVTRYQVQHMLRPNGLCLWSLNTYTGSKRLNMCTVRGLRINVLDGSCEPFEIRSMQRGYPFTMIRGTRFLTEPVSNEAIAPLCVRPCDGELTVRFTEVEPKIGATEANDGPIFKINFKNYLSGVRSAISQNMPIPIVVAPSHFESVPKYLGMATDAQAAVMSTTPHCEPIDYAPSLAARLRYGAQATTAGVFGEPLVALTNMAPV